MAKANKAEAESRLTQVQSWLLGGYTRADILRFAAKWNIAERTIEEYMKKAWEFIHEHGRSSREQNLSQIASNLWDLYRKSLVSDDRGTAFKALAQLAKIRGLEVQTVNHHVQDIRELKDKTDEELDSILLGSDDVAAKD